MHCGLAPTLVRPQTSHSKGGKQVEEDLTVTASVPENCPYKLEHLLLEEATAGLKEGWDDERTGQ